MASSLLVPVDDSPHARRAAERALDLAAAWDARLTALHVDSRARSEARLARLSATLPPGAAVPPAAPVIAARPAVLDWLAREAAARKIPCDVKVAPGRPHEAILT